MTTRLYTPEDYATVMPWWEGHGSLPIPEAVLPKCGIVVEMEEGLPSAVAWLYMDNSVGVAWMSWMTTNPLLGPIKAASALTVLLGAMEQLCAEFDYGLLFTMTESKGVGQFLCRKGFSPNHKGMTQYFKEV
tara:strand:- start:327 stop:722 length:396 start_codon:yes stop_codon:yes gene_type:complete